MDENQEKLYSYIKDRVSAGKSDEEIAQPLIAAGWAEDSVRTTLRTIKVQQVYTASATKGIAAATDPAPSQFSTVQNQNTSNTEQLNQRYTVIEALSASLSAFVSNIFIITVAVIISAALSAAISYGQLYLLLMLWSGSEISGAITIFAYIVPVIASSLTASVMLAGYSLPYKNEAEGASTSFTDLISFILSKFFKLFIVSIIGITVAMVFVGLLSYLFFFALSTGSMYASWSYLLSMILPLAGVILFALAPYIAMFENTNPFKAYFRSITLLGKEGMWFVLKFVLFLIVAIIIFTRLSPGYYSSLNLLMLGSAIGPIGAILFTLISSYISSIVNGMFVNLYLNRIAATSNPNQYNNIN